MRTKFLIIFILILLVSSTGITWNQPSWNSPSWDNNKRTNWDYDSGITLSNDQSTPNQTEIQFKGTTGHDITIYWGDGNVDSFNMEGIGTELTKTHDYGNEGIYTVQITGALDEITYFECTESSISGNIKQFNTLTSLTSLYLSSTSVTGDIANLNTLTNLTSLYLYSTSVSGDIAGINTLTSLTSLYLYDTSVSGDIADINNLTSLTRLHLGSTSVSGDIANLNTLTSLTSLYLYNTSVSGDIAGINTLTNLTYLYLYDTSVSDYTTTTLPDWETCDIQINDLGLTTTEVDNFLIDLDNATGAPGNGILNISGTNAARSSDSDAAMTSLVDVKSWVITVNES